MAELKLVIFDVDGTLVDSLADIGGAMSAAFKACDMPQPDAKAVSGIIGLSLPVAIDRLHPGLSDAELEALVAAYAGHFSKTAEAEPKATFFPGALQSLQDLSAQEEMLLGVATGNSRRGVNRILGAHQLEHVFQTVQVADDHPSKPHPSMVEQCLRDTGVDACNAVIIGDTTFDLEMGRSAGIGTIGVDWGYHDTSALMPWADRIIADFGALHGALTQIWETAR